MLFCAGSCGKHLDNERNCQKSDADAYCKLRFCDEGAFAISFEVTDGTNKPGFACSGIGKNYGNWFRMTNVYFDDDIAKTHCGGRCTGNANVVSNVICQTSGKYNYYF